MKATELRLGNLVENQKGNIEPILGLYTIPNYVEVTTENRVGLAGDFKPIPLTEEWLERFGFEEKMIYNSIHYELGDFKVYINIDNGQPSGFFDYHRVSMIGIKAQLDYVHQLQNLYFALTGEELTLIK